MSEHYKILAGTTRNLLIVKFSAGQSGDVFLNTEGLAKLRQLDSPLPKIVEARVRQADGYKTYAVPLEYIDTLDPINEDNTKGEASYRIYDGTEFVAGASWSPPPATSHVPNKTTTVAFPEKIIPEGEVVWKIPDENLNSQLTTIYAKMVKSLGVDEIKKYVVLSPDGKSIIGFRKGN